MNKHTDEFEPTILPTRKQKLLHILTAEGSIIRGKLIAHIEDGYAVFQFADGLAPVHMSRVQNEPCTKCGGSGDFVMGVHNGVPYSSTGFKCWKCNGSGWQEYKE